LGDAILEEGRGISVLKIIVCVKAVPDPRTADKIKIDPITKSLPRMDIPLVMNPMDAHAVEAAIHLKKKYEAFVTIICMGPPLAGNVVRECLALGADKGILLTDRAFAGADAYATAYTLAKAIEKNMPVDLVICGMASSDGATEWVGPEISAFLGFPVVTMVREIVSDSGDEWIIHADYRGGYRMIRLKLPAVITVTRKLNKPKPLSFSGILKARNIEISKWNLETLGISKELVGIKGSPTCVSEMHQLKSQRQVQILEGTLIEKVERLSHILSDAGVV
jgi:electron transfer flavoprotein alpha/beta subunit